MELITRRYIHARMQELQLAGQEVQTQGESGSGSASGCQEPDMCRFIDHTTAEYRRMVESIRKEMNFISLKFNNIEGLISSIGLPKESLCTYCFDGSGCRD